MAMAIADTTLYILVFLFIAVLVALLVNMLKRRAAKDLLNQNQFLQTLINSIPSPVFYKNRAGVYLGCNKAFSTMLGLPVDEIVGKTVYDLSPKELAAIYEQADNDLFAAGNEQRYETQVKFADGSIHEMFFTKAVFQDVQGQLAGLLGIMIDISDRKNAEEALKRAHSDLEDKVKARTIELETANARLETEVEERGRAERESREKSAFLDTVINSIDYGIVVIDAEDFTVRLANSAACRDGCSGGEHCYELLHNQNTPCVDEVEICPLLQVKATGKPTITQHTHQGADGRKKFVEIHSFPVFDENGKVTQIIDNIMDVTTRRETEVAMIEAKDMAEKTSRLMSEFLDTVSHELRTPMTSVQGFAKLIQKAFRDNFSPAGHDDPKLHKVAKRIEENVGIIISESERLSGLINDHLDLSKLQSGSIEWRWSHIAPSDIVGRTEAAVSSLFAGRDLALITRVEPDLPLILCDQDRLLQVLINLVSNAVKFTEHGTIECSAERRRSSVVFAVKDTGKGIPEALHEEIFSKFRQVQSDLDGKPAGTGLGLAISKEIVHHHGGKIWVESSPGKGSTFFFSIPLH